MVKKTLDEENILDSSGIADQYFADHSGEIQQGYEYGSLTQGLVAYYAMQEGGGEVLHDGALDNLGQINGSSWESNGPVGDSYLSFNGQSDYVQIGSPIPDSEDLQARYDATELSLSDGDTVSTWSDETANGHDLTAGTAPTYVASGIGGNPVVRFDGVDDFLDVSFTELPQPNHIFVVFQYQSTTSGSTEFLYDGQDSAGRNAIGAREGGGGGGWKIYSGSGSLTGSAVDTNSHIAAALHDSTAVLRIDGAEEVSGSSGSDGLNGLTLGQNIDGNYSNVDIGEVLIYPMDKTSVQGDVESYLADKWRISI